MAEPVWRQGCEDLEARGMLEGLQEGWAVVGVAEWGIQP